MSRLIRTVLVAAIVAAACGSNDATDGDAAVRGDDPAASTSSTAPATAGEAPDESADETVTSADADADVNTADEADGTDPDEGGAESAIEVKLPDRWLDTVASGTPNRAGWPIDAGLWASAAFADPVVLDVPPGLRLRDHGPWSIRFAAADGTPGQIHIVQTSALTLSTGQSVPVPKSVDEVTAFIEESSRSRLEDLGRSETPSGEFGWWELTIEPDLPGYPCSIGANCVSLALTRSGEAVEVVPGERVRIMSTFIGNERFGAYVTAPAGELSNLVPQAEALMQSLAIATDDAAAPVGSDRFIGSLTRQADDVATYHDLLGSAHVSFTTGADLDAAIVVNEPQIVILASPVGDLAFVAYDGLAVDPSIDQSVIVDPSEASSLPRIDPAPSSIDEWVSYADELGEVTATGFADVGGTEVGGTEVPWFEFAVVPGSGFECELGRLGTVECINFLERWWHSSAESKNRHLVFGDVGVMVIVFPSASIDQAMDGWQPLFDTLSIEPVS